MSQQPERRIGPYTIIRKLGSGAFGTVWLAEKRTTIATTRVALKIPREEDIDLKAVQQEATVWVHASGHPNVLPIIDADVYDGQVLIVSEYAPDGSLGGWLKKHGGQAPDLDSALDMAVGFLAGLQHLHDRQIIHRDLKPENILLQGETPRLADFGIARLLKTTSHSTQISGTLAYMAPEAFDGARTVQTDLWSAGVICYLMLAGRLPYPQAEVTSLVGALLRYDAPPLPESIPPGIRDVVMLALRRTPSERFRSAGAMRQALRAAARTDSAPWRPDTNPVGAETDPTRPLQMDVVAETLPIVPPGETEPRILPLKKPEVERPPRDRVAWAFGIGGAGAILALFVGLILLFGTVYYFWPKKNSVTQNGPGTVTTPKTAPGTTNDPTVASGANWIYVQALSGDKGGPGSAAFSPDSKTVACVWNYVGSPTVKTFDVKTGKQLSSDKPIGEWVNSLSFSPDGQYLVGTLDNSYAIWNATTGVRFREVKADDKVDSTVFSPDGKYLATAGKDEKITLWTPGTWEKVRNFAGGTYVGDLAFSSDGTLLISGPSLTIYDVATGAVKRKLTAPNDKAGPASVVFSADGNLIAVGNMFTNTADLWDANSGTLLHTFDEFSGWVDSVAFTSDSRYLAMRSRDGKLQIGDVKTFKIVQTLPNVHADESGGDDDLEISPDGNWMISGDGVGGFALYQRGP